MLLHIRRSGSGIQLAAGVLAAGLVLGACGDDDSVESVAGTGGGAGRGAAGGGAGGAGSGAAQDLDPQLPPSDAARMADWLDAAFYEDWACETEATLKDEGAAAIHAHGMANRVCSNIRLATASIGDSGELPRGVASVKEIYDADDELIARVVAVKTAAESDDGAGWYWYAGPDMAGMGLQACTGCHSAAAADADHPGAGDFVYFHVRDEAQLPPTGSASAMKTWLDAKHYGDWSCEPAATEKKDGDPAIHAHRTKNRVCTNERLASGAKKGGEWPAGVASVKELFDGDTVVGLDVSLKVAAESGENGAGWYWYGGPTTAGFGLAGCTGCHAAAASDSDHPGAGDFVYWRETP